MTVKELIEKLSQFPEDYEVSRMNTEEDRWFPTHYDEIVKVISGDYDGEVYII